MINYLWASLLDCCGFDILIVFQKCSSLENSWGLSGEGFFFSVNYYLQDVLQQFNKIALISSPNVYNLHQQ